jgi:glycine/D-amino acid oxidase-like deaminating enzyme
MRLTSDDLPASADVVVIGAGVVGAACALALADAGRSVCVLDRDGPAAGTSSSGEGNLLVSDKPPGPELDLALHSLRLWRDFAGRDGVEFEFEAKGGLLVAASPESLSRLAGTVAGQRAAGVEVAELTAGQLPGFEPRLASDLVGGAYYPQDCQVQPMLAVRALLAEAVRVGARVVAGVEVTSGVGGAGTAGAVEVRTTRGVIRAPAVIVAAGVWSAAVARRFGGHAPVVPRRGHVVVTEPLPPVIRYKVYEADYMSDVDSDDGGLLCSAVVEGTRGGPVLLGASRELVGLDRRLSATAVATIARRTARLFPFLREVRAIRAYLGFRPASPDHLPIIGPDGGVPGLWHATGHEGAGFGLALGTADLLRALITGSPPPVDPAPFTPSRPTLRPAAATAGHAGEHADG